VLNDWIDKSDPGITTQVVRLEEKKT